MALDAVVLAGGLGTRLRDAVPDLPKPMAPVLGRPFLEWLLEHWMGQGIRRFVLSVGHRAECIAGHFGSAWRGAQIEYAVEAAPLGTGGGLLLALQLVRTEDVLVLNGDTYFAVTLADIRQTHGSAAADGTLALHRSLDRKRYLGVTLGHAGRILALDAVPSDDLPLVNGGVYLFRRTALETLPWRPGDCVSLEADLLPYVLRSGWRLVGRQCAAPFIDIGIPDDYLRASSVLSAPFTS